jgi:hypothetical protein
MQPFQTGLRLMLVLWKQRNSCFNFSLTDGNGATVVNTLALFFFEK